MVDGGSSALDPLPSGAGIQGMGTASGMNLLIISNTQDVHALAVATALEALGHGCVVWSEPHVAGEHVGSVRFHHGEVQWTVCGRTYVPSDFDVVWLRRIGKMELPDWLHPDDRKFAAVDNAAFFGFLWSPLGASVRWLHSPAVRWNGESKIQQLRQASLVGFQIPDTLISNDPEAIRQFILDRSADGHGTIFKTFGSMTWIEKDGVRENYTSGITADDLTDPDTIRAVPAIYQSRIEKQYEIRSTFFGGQEYSVRIDSQSSAVGRLDWRAIDDLQGVLSPIELPAEIRGKCLEFMRAMALDMGCFDFIVDRSGNCIFVEVNQQGQFLWVEDDVPSMRVLGGFCEFVIGLSSGACPPQAAGSNGIELQAICASHRYAQLAAQLSSAGAVDTRYS